MGMLTGCEMAPNHCCAGRREKDGGVPLQEGMDASGGHMAVPSQVPSARDWRLLF